MDDLVHQNVEEIAVVMPSIPQERFEQLEDTVRAENISELIHPARKIEFESWK